MSVVFFGFFLEFSSSTRRLVFSKFTFVLRGQSMLKITMNCFEDKDYM